MTADEIREQVKTFKLHEDKLPVDILSVMQWQALMEIAAQLAELNKIMELK